jgi:chromate reductase, NAD(P)H dehydrogenase (quinone)
VALLGATPGPGGTRLSQAAWLPVLRCLNLTLWSGRLIFVANATKAFDAQGKLVDETVKKYLPKFMQEFAAFVKKR